MKTLVMVISLLQVVVQVQTDKGSVTGRIRSADGTPTVGVRVAAMVAPEPGVSAADTGSAMASLAQTDSAGNFRLENIPPGRYYITAGFVDFPTYYPGTAAITGATAILVPAGATTANIDFPLARPVNLKVSGRVTGTLTALPLPLRQVTLLPRRAGTILNAPLSSDGTFEFANVVPGAYSVQFSGRLLKENPVITVNDKDVSGIELVVVDTDTVTSQQGLEQVWSLSGTWRGLSTNEKTREIYAADGRSIATIDATGKTVRQFAGSGAILRRARLSASGDSAILSFGTWSPQVTAYSSSGQMLWSYPKSGEASTGLDDVWPVDLNGDNVDEIGIGFNGGTGVRVVNAHGNLLWQSTAIGNVWHVSGGKVRSDGTSSVVTTSARGQVHVFNADGKGPADLLPGFYANMVRVGRAASTETFDTILAAGTPSSPTGGNTVSVASLSGTGTLKWTVQLPSNVAPSVYSATASESKPWFALGLQGGQIYVLDIATGATIASVDGQGQRPQVEWIGDGNGSAQLVVAAENKLTLFKVSQQAP
jgi:Carboxypeptidase regulatory-like domain